MYNKSLLSIAIVLALSPSAYADDYASFDEVVVSATRTNQTLGNTAAKVDVVSDKDIEKNMSKDVAEVFEYTPGVTVNGSNRQGIQTVNIRGVEGNRVKILVDGVAQGQSFDGGNTEFVNSSAVYIEPDMVKSVEVVKGAASSLHGSDAVGGVVAFETKDPRDFLKDGESFGGQVKLSYFSEDKSFSEHVALANRIGDLETLVAFTRRDGQNVNNFANDEHENYSVTDQDTEKNDLLLKLQYQLNPAHRIELLGEITHNESNSDIYHATYTNYTGDDTTKKTRLGLKHIWNADIGMADTITSKVTWQKKDDNGVTHRSTSSNNQTKDYVYKDNRWDVETQLDKLLTTGSVEHNFIYGISLTAADIENTNMQYDSSTNSSSQIVYTPDAKERKVGVFLQDEMAFLNGDLIVTPGLRYDWFNTNPGDVEGTSYETYKDSAVTGRVGAVYHLNIENSVFSQVSQGFRAPTFSELYYVYAGGCYYGFCYENIPNPDLKSEESISYELGYRHKTDASRSEISVFYSDYDNFIDQTSTNDGSMTSYYYTNIDKATIKGVELSNTLLLDKLVNAPQGMSTKLVAAYTEGEDGEGNPLNSVNPWNAVVALNYDAPSTQWGSSLKVNYTAKKSSSDINSEDSAQTELPSATIIDITAYYKPIKDVTLTAGIFNLTDKEYYKWNDVRGSSELDLDKSQPKRNFAITAKYEF
ncbi:TonB-dependent hemoglobin/transferrin/lactoferrin family receptor [Vibrio fluvialis]|uniref:TonB-dependent hemoglobin/transferrin/lactoferrin family receptor n=1 Tax=Vibrio fluvialis TaxID=676 RepID=UPI00192B736C|nr:TonB-dependent hemoglobin/transferrin/lactoferrin family receptor [Vibrio fluvialis]MBL4282636.1 TonB-dependent hemoglobin/transferrin/lactoferrin family receptor [Vibrio fluvialis]